MNFSWGRWVGQTRWEGMCIALKRGYEGHSVHGKLHISWVLWVTLKLNLVSLLQITLESGHSHCVLSIDKKNKKEHQSALKAYIFCANSQLWNKLYLFLSFCWVYSKVLEEWSLVVREKEALPTWAGLKQRAEGHHIRYKMIINGTKFQAHQE